MFDEKYIPIDVILDSNDKDYGTKDYPNFILHPSVEDVVGVSCFYASVPFTYNVVDAQNNKFTIAITGGSTYNVVLTEGSYTTTSLIQEIRAQFRDLDVGSDYLSFNFFIDGDTNEFVIYNNATPDHQFTLTFPALDGAGELLGFENGSTYTSSNADILDNSDTLLLSTEYIRGPYSVNLSGPSQMFLHCPQLQGLIKDSVRAGGSGNDVVAFWGVNSNYLGYITFDPHNPAIIPFTQTTISNLSFYLTLSSKEKYGSAGAPQLSLKGLSYQIGLRFYRKNSQYVETNDESKRITSQDSTNKRMRSF